MAGYRKLGRTSSVRKAMLKSQVTSLLYYGRITTTETRAKEVRKIAEKLITLAIAEKDNYTTETVTVKVPKKTADGKRVKNIDKATGKKVTVYEEIQKTIKVDAPSRLHARRQMLEVLVPVTSTPKDGVKMRSLSKKVDVVAKMFDEIGPKYADRKGGYTRIIKCGPRKGDGAEVAIIELV